jgi:hypothetical protein
MTGVWLSATPKPGASLNRRNGRAKPTNKKDNVRECKGQNHETE